MIRASDSSCKYAATVENRRMTGLTPWFTQLRETLHRQRDDDDPTEQVSLAAQELLSTVPDHEICEAYRTWTASPANH
jgi:hypothetical protein